MHLYPLIRAHFTRRTSVLKSLLTASAITVLLTGTLPAQNADPQQTCIIAGAVVDAVTQQPVRGASVTARTLMGGMGAKRGNSVSANSDATGRFLFSGLAAGRYLITATHDGYVTQGLFPGRRGKITVVAPGDRADVTVPLQPGGVITGHITDGDGKPLAGVSLSAIRSSYRSGQLELTSAMSSSTNPSGEYTIAGLNPGKYYLRVTSTHTKGIKLPPDQGYVPLYYPGTSDQSSATALTVDAGQQLAGIDMNLVPVHTVHVAGRVIDARNSRATIGADLTLVSAQGSVVFSRHQTSAAPKGTFDFPGIPRGSYILTAELSSDPSKTILGRTPVEVADANVNDVEVAVGPGVDISGHLRADAKTSQDLSQVSITLEPTGGSSSSGDSYEATIKSDGSFVFQDIPEGSYRLDVSPIPSGFYLSDNGSDVLESGVVVSRGHPVPGLELSFNSGIAQIDGSVTDEDQPSPGITVVLVPDARRRGQPRYYKVAMTSPSGRFVLRGVAPGEYTLFAWEVVDRDAYMNPDFVQQYQDRGKEISVEPSAHLTTQLQLIPAEE